MRLNWWLLPNLEKDCFWKYHGRSSYRSRNSRSWNRGRICRQNGIGLGANVSVWQLDYQTKKITK
jgi:hypothetical protein